MMPATPKEKAQASARLKDPAQAKQVKVWSRGVHTYIPYIKHPIPTACG